MDGMDNLLMTYRDMTARDWLVDAAVTLAAFAVGCLQLMLTASSIIIPDLALRQYLGVVNVVPDLQVFVGLGMTVVPLVLRRRFPLPVFAACLVIFLGLQVRFSGFSMTVVGPLVALYTVAAECGTVPGVACGAAAVLSLLFAGAPMQAASMVFFTRFQNIALMVAAVLAGYAYRTHVAYVRAVEQRAAEAERTREEEAARRVEEERVRIARAAGGARSSDGEGGGVHGARHGEGRARRHPLDDRRAAPRRRRGRDHARRGNEPGGRAGVVSARRRP